MVPPIICELTGAPVRATPEEAVRQRTLRELITRYRYVKADLAREFPIKMGSSRLRCDIVAFMPGSARRQEDILLIVECKAETVRQSEQDEAIAQLKSYMAACTNARYGVFVARTRFVFRETKRRDDGVYETREELEVPTAEDLARARFTAHMVRTPLAPTARLAGQPRRMNLFWNSSRRRRLARLSLLFISAVLVISTHWLFRRHGNSTSAGSDGASPSSAGSALPRFNPALSNEARIAEPVSRNSELTNFVVEWAAAVARPGASLDRFYTQNPSYHAMEGAVNADRIGAICSDRAASGGSFSVDMLRSTYLTEAIGAYAPATTACGDVDGASGDMLKLRLWVDETVNHRPNFIGCNRLIGVYLLRARRVAGSLRICWEGWSRLEGICSSCPTSQQCPTR